MTASRLSFGPGEAAPKDLTLATPRPEVSLRPRPRPQESALETKTREGLTK